MQSKVHKQGEGRAKFSPAVTRGASADRSVAYMAAPPNVSELEFPDGYKKQLRLIVIAACVIGAVILFLFVDNVFLSPARDAAAVEEQIASGEKTEVPRLVDYMGMSNDEIKSSLATLGTTLYTKTETDDGNELEIISLPEGVTLADAAALYALGINNLSATQAFSLLNGSWEFSVDREISEVLGLHWADFSGEDAETAVYNAAVAQGFGAAAASDSGVDTSGNTYLEGSFVVSGVTYTWRVSAIALSEIYSVSGLPESSLYIGVRVTP